MLCFTLIEDDDFAFINPRSDFKHLNIYTIHVHGVQSASLFLRGWGLLILFSVYQLNNENHTF